MVSAEDGGSALLQCSQVGRSSSMAKPFVKGGEQVRPL
jgi:hypothetical protein